MGLITTKTFGPIISTIIFMFNDIAVFIVIWIIVLVMFGTIGALTFNETPELVAIEESMEFFVTASLGSWSTSIFDHYAEGTPPRKFMRDVGVYFVLTFNFINVLILLNVVIALMADTYSLMSGVRKGLYNYSIVKTVPAYKLDSYYGGLALLMPPFCLFTFFCMPYYLCVKDRKRL